MWIRTQDRTELIDVYGVKVGTLFGSKGDEATVLGLYGKSTIVLGTYKTKEDAINEINSLQSYILCQPKGVYNMR